MSLFVEGDLLGQVANEGSGHILLRCAVPQDSITQNGLQIYGAECGRFPICPTLVLEW